MKKLIVMLLACALVLSMGAGFVFAGEADQAAADEVATLIDAISMQISSPLKSASLTASE